MSLEGMTCCWRKSARLIVEYGKLLLARRLTVGTGGNLSVYDRASGYVAISPSGIDYESTQPGDVVVVDMSGAVVDGCRRPSSELAMHLALYEQRPDVCAVVHTHSVFATTLACLECSLPAVHYLIGFAGKEVRCAPYATFGTRELADVGLRHDRGCTGRAAGSPWPAGLRR